MLDFSGETGLQLKQKKPTEQRRTAFTLITWSETIERVARVIESHLIDGHPVCLQASTGTPIKTPACDSSLTAPTPQNTPLSHAPISSGLARPGVSDIQEENEGAEELSAVLQSRVARTALQGIVQKRLASLIGQSSGYIEGLNVETKRSLAALHGIQAKHELLKRNFKRELWGLERKYFDRTKPLYTRRADIVSGTAAPTLDEIEAGEAQAKKDDEDYVPLPEIQTQPESAPIPDFWLNVLQNHPGVRSLLSVRDLDALSHLKNVQLSYLQGSGVKTEAEEKEGEQLGYKLSFFFSPNEVFENEVLQKTYLYKSEIDWAGDYVYERAIGTDIRWKEGNDLTKDSQTKTQRHKHTNRVRTVQRTVDVESFFKFFNPPLPPSDEAIEKDEIDDDELSELEAELTIDFQLGDDFKDRIIPHAVDYFTGKALEWEEDDDDDEEWSDDETEEEDEEADDVV